MQTVHSIIDLPIREGPIGSSIPILVLMDGEISQLGLMWARHLMLQEHYSPSSLEKRMSAIGRFYDFYVIEKHAAPVATDALHILLQQFFEARRFGSATMGWETVRPQTAVADVRAVTEFTEWAAKNFGTARVNPTERTLVSSLNLSDQKRYRIKQDGKRNWDQLYHLSPSTEEGKGVVNVPEFNPKSERRVDTVSKKYFPPTRVAPFIKASPIRDALYFLLIFFGSLRASEPLHIFAGDVSILPDGTARVVLGHPELGPYRWFDSSGKERAGKRVTFLRERYQLGPRHFLGTKHPQHAGWKGMRFDANAYESEVYWLRPDAGRLFAKLHSEYMKSIRLRVTDNHPYYFVNTDPGPDFGNPVTLSNMTKAFERAAQRVGLSASEPGVNPHGGRHFYGFYNANILRTSMEILQMLMHHTSILSTKVYYNLTPEVARIELAKAHAKMEAEIPEMLRMDQLFLEQSRT
ncbi:hypothetical protein [Paraburkholderia phytofirmans]|uniref:hypothetical protein n=1 Tax=Paraburkholderia phytofirmans TaxID=261302 RepID=UPI0038BCD1C0